MLYHVHVNGQSFRLLIEFDTSFEALLVSSVRLFSVAHFPFYARSVYLIVHSFTQSHYTQCSCAHVAHCALLQVCRNDCPSLREGCFSVCQNSVIFSVLYVLTMYFILDYHHQHHSYFSWNFISSQKVMPYHQTSVEVVCTGQFDCKMPHVHWTILLNEAATYRWQTPQDVTLSTRLLLHYVV